jgi:hypothetical protein
MIFLKMFLYTLHYHLEVQVNPKEIGQKKPRLLLASMGETGLFHNIYF